MSFSGTVEKVLTNVLIAESELLCKEIMYVSDLVSQTGQLPSLSGRCYVPKVKASRVSISKARV